MLDENAYVKTVAPLSKNPAIDRAVAAQLTQKLFAHVDVAKAASKVLPPNAHLPPWRLAASLRSFTEETVARFLASDRFQLLWMDANRRAHAGLVAALQNRAGVAVDHDGAVSIDLSQAAVEARRRLAAQGIHVFDNVPDSALARKYAIGRSQWLARARYVMRLHAVAVALPIVGLLAFLTALGLSRNRRRSLLQAGVGLSLAGAAAIGVVVVLRSIYLDHVVLPSVPHDAGAAFFDTLTRSPRLGLRVEFLVGVALIAAAVATNVLGRSSGARRSE